jgi:lysophospholipase L1-like esterase
MPFYAVDPARKTVVTLGDSFTEGFPVDDSDNYPSVLGRLLDERGMPVNIINMGMGDSGPDQQLRLMKEYVLPRLTPDIVVWAFYANDVWDNLQQAVYDIKNGSLVPLDASKHWLYIRHKIYLNIPLPGTLKGNSPVLRLVFRALEIWGKRRIHQEDPSQQTWSVENVRLAINEMERLARIYGFRVTYVLIAPQALYLKAQDPMRWGRNILNEALIDQYMQLEPIIAEQARAVDVSIGGTKVHVCGSDIEVPSWSALFTDDGRDHNQPGYRHYNEAGYHLLADIVATCLLQ